MAIGDQIPVGRAKDISGQIFGPFTVLYRCEYKNDRPYWKVKCNSCGAESIKAGSKLTAKNKNLTCQECGKIDNKAGQKFGMLTVTKEWKRKNNRIYWKCICECGKETWVSTGNLSGQKSCGCLSGQNQKIKKEKREKEWAKLNPGDKIPIGKAKDLTGKKFKRLTALYRCVPPESYSKDTYHSAFWMCKCDCGEHVIVTAYQLQHGNTYSCGCYSKELNKQNLEKMHKDHRQRQIDKYKNKKFGLLTALYPLENSTNGYITWHCKCECGRELDISTEKLLRKYSCGCIQGSAGEQRIHHHLFNRNIKFEREKTFNDCINSNTNTKLRFDFYLPDYDCCIEYDGEQHFKESSMCGDSLEDRQMRDQIKTQYCKDHGIKLIRIPYTEYDNIETILDKELLQLTEAK